MTPVWLQRGCEAFGAVESFIAQSIWDEPRKMPGDTILVSFGLDGAAKGAAIFQNYDKFNGTIEISAASIATRWLSRGILHEMFAYPFNQLGCQAVILRCADTDKRMARILPAYGFNRYDIPRLRGRDKPEAIYVLGDDEWHANGFHKEH